MSNLKAYVRGAYDLQKLRIQAGNRIVANFKSKLGLEPSEAEKDSVAEKLLKKIREEYKRITDSIAKITAKFPKGELISTTTELVLVAQYFDLESAEEKHFKYLGVLLKDEPVYSKYLKGVKGVGPAMAGVIITEIDIHKAKYPSSLWMYAGLDVAPDGEGRSRKKHHLVDKEYTDSEGEVTKTKGITFNPFLKTKLTGVLGPSFLRAGDNQYSIIYRDYKNRLENHEKHKDKTKQHRHNMAIRYAVKIFLVDLHKAWRKIEGLPVSEPYHVAKLGYNHKKASRARRKPQTNSEPNIARTPS